jgi:hypothetical protein
MLTDLLRIITPEALAAAIRGNPKVVQSALQKFESYASFGQAMSVQQQVCVSNNLDKLSSFFKTDTGKGSLHALADEFVKYVNSTSKNLLDSK